MIKKLFFSFLFVFVIPADISGLSGRLVQAAKQKGSSDNISVIVVFFRQPELIAKRPLPPPPPPPTDSVLSSASAAPTMEQQQHEYEQLAAKWGWNDPQGGAVFDGTPWQQQPEDASASASGQSQPHNPFDTSNPFGNGGGGVGGVGSGVGWDGQADFDGRQTIPDEPAEEDETADIGAAQWGWKDPEIEALEIEAGRDSSASAGSGGGHFVATSVVPLSDVADVADLDRVRDQYEKVTAKWGRELEQFNSGDASGDISDSATAPHPETKSVKK